MVPTGDDELVYTEEPSTGRGFCLQPDHKALAQERDRYRDALEQMARPHYTQAGSWWSRLAREALAPCSRIGPSDHAASETAPLHGMRRDDTSDRMGT